MNVFEATGAGQLAVQQFVTQGPPAELFWNIKEAIKEGYKVLENVAAQNRDKYRNFND